MIYKILYRDVVKKKFYNIMEIRIEIRIEIKYLDI